MTETIIIDEGFDYVEKQRNEAARRRKQDEQLRRDRWLEDAIKEGESDDF